MGELQDAVIRSPGRALALGIVTALAACVPTDPAPSPGATRTGGPLPTAATTGSGAPPGSPPAGTVRPDEGRLVWTVDARGSAGIWTTDLAGNDRRTFVASVGDERGAIREAALAGASVVFVRDAPGGPQLWAVREGGPPARLLDGVVAWLVVGDAEIVAVHDAGPERRVVRIQLDRGQVVPIGALTPDDPTDVEVGPFGLAVSPDGRTVAAGRVGGAIEVVGGVTAVAGRDIGAPLVVADDGTVVATEGRAGEAYLVRDGELVDLAPPDSDPVVAPGTSIVAWGSVAADGSLLAVEVHDVLSGAARSHPASGPATNVRWISAGAVLLEATSFDPLRRSAALLDLATGRFGTFEAAAPGP